MQKLIDTLKNRRKGILFVLKMVPEELWDWKPEHSMRTVAELANHLALAPLSMLELLRGELKDGEAFMKLEKENMAPNPRELTKVYEQSLSKLILFLEEHIEDAHEEKIKLFYQDHLTSLYKEIFEEIGHEWFHLGQLFTYLRQKGVPIDMGAYYGYKDPDPNIPPNE
ncbi:MAG: DinB family protein [Candidatus Hermodarchaeota archaeon]